MELQQLRAFVAVAEELHFGRAAERLHLAQPYLSRTVRALEEDLRAALFRRTTRRVELTAAGAALLEPARVLLATSEQDTFGAATVRQLTAVDAPLVLPAPSIANTA